MMQTVKQLAHIGEDGVLRVEMPMGMTNIDVEYTIVYQVQRPPMTQEEWSAFIEQTYGSLADNPIEEVRQLPLEQREDVE